MASDAEMIIAPHFNKKFKNYLRDFYVYQFKDRELDFKVKGAGENANVNKGVNYNTFTHDSARLRYILEEAAGIQWCKGDVVDKKRKRIHPSRKNKRVECITVDSRKIAHNPFFLLYQYRNEDAGKDEDRGSHFAFLYSLIIYFNSGKNVRRSDYADYTQVELSALTKYLKYLAENIESVANRHRLFAWDEFSDEKKERFAIEAIERFIKYGTTRDGELKEVFTDKEMTSVELNINLEELRKKIILNKQKIVYNNESFTVEYDLSNTVEKELLYEALSHYVSVGERQFLNKMDYFSRIGLIKKEKIGQRLLYTFCESFLDIIADTSEDFKYRLRLMLSFFSETCMLGEVGSFILKKIPFSTGDDEYIYYKHNYLKRVLNDYNNIDLLYATRINRQYVDKTVSLSVQELVWSYIEYRNASPDDLEFQKIFCLPIEIRESVTDGRQYLIYYHFTKRSVSAMRIEFIDQIVLGNFDLTEQLSDESGLHVKDYFDQDITRAKTLINHTWGTAFENFSEENVKSPISISRVRIIVKCGESEPFIRKRLYREMRNRAVINDYISEEHGSCVELVAEVAYPWEMLPWLRSYTTRIVSVEINGEQFSGIKTDLEQAFALYEKQEIENRVQVPSRSGKSMLLEEIPANFLPLQRPGEDYIPHHTMLFNEVFGVFYERLGAVLSTVMLQKSGKKSYISEIITNYAESFSSELFRMDVDDATVVSRLSQVENFLYPFLKKDKDNFQAMFGYEDCSTIKDVSLLIPLSHVERQWLCNVLSHPMAPCFMSSDEITRLKAQLDNPNLFDINDCVLYDQHIKDNNNNAKRDTCGNTRKVLEAIHQRNIITITYESQRGRKSNYLCAPGYLEYSKRDNQMRLRAVVNEKKAKTFNMERVLKIQIHRKEFFDMVLIREVIDKISQENERELVVSFKETKNVPDRILTEFSCYKKKCIKWDSEEYRMTLYYDNEDRLEILIRLLSYGSSIKVLSDSGDVLKELKERLSNQISIFEQNVMKVQDDKLVERDD